MKKLLFLLTFTLIGCDSQNDVYGQWVNIDDNCTVLCSFTVKKHTNAYSEAVAIFDQGPFYKAASGPLISDNQNRYLIRGGNGDILLILKDGRLYGTDNSIYEKIDKEN